MRCSTWSVKTKPKAKRSRASSGRAPKRASPTTGALWRKRSRRPAMRARNCAECASTMANKYGARCTVVDGIAFDSAKEARVYGELVYRQKAGEVLLLELQPRFPIHIGERRICEYRADFQYLGYARTTPRRARCERHPHARLSAQTQARRGALWHHDYRSLS